MNSVISLDGNGIFAVARMFEQMNTKTAVPMLQPITLGNLG